MAHQDYIADGITYTVAPDVPARSGQQVWALAELHAVDELTGLPPQEVLNLTCSNAEAFPRVAEGGIVGVTGIPVDALSELAINNYTLALTITAERYLPLTTSVPINAIPSFPELFNTPPAMQVAMHRAPVVIKGKVAISSGVTSAPVPNAAVSMTGMWRTVPPANVVVPPLPPDIVSLMPGFYFARSAATTQIAQQALVPVVGADKQLLVDASQGATSIRLSDCVGLAVNDVLAIDADDPYRTEFMTILNIFAASTTDQPATIVFTFGLQGTHRQRSPVRKVNVPAAGAATPLSVDAIAADVCAFVGNAAALQPATTVKITDLANPTEYQAISYFNTKTDAQGFYQLPALSRVAQLNLQANVGAVPPPMTQTFVPDYSMVEGKLDFTF